MDNHYPEVTVPRIRFDQQHLRTSAEEQELMQRLSAEAEASLGSVMVFNLVCSLQEWLEAHPRKVEEAEARNAPSTIIEERRLDSHGTPVTPELFNVWLREIMQREDVEAAAETSEGVRLTGTNSLLMGRAAAF